MPFPRNKSFPYADFDVILTTYEMASREKALLRIINFDCVVVDEAHHLKNESTKV